MEWKRKAKDDKKNLGENCSKDGFGEVSWRKTIGGAGLGKGGQPSALDRRVSYRRARS